MTLWHYTCQHGRDALGEAGHLLPGWDQVAAERRSLMPWTSRFVWVTDLAVPMRDALGLTSRILRCDRTAYQYRVTDDTEVVAWTTMAHRLRIPWPERDVIEGEPGAEPRHWYVSTEPVPVVLHEAEVRGVLSAPSVVE